MTSPTDRRPHDAEPYVLRQVSYWPDERTGPKAEPVIDAALDEWGHRGDTCRRTGGEVYPYVVLDVYECIDSGALFFNLTVRSSELIDTTILLYQPHHPHPHVPIDTMPR